MAARFLRSAAPLCLLAACVGTDKPATGDTEEEDTAQDSTGSAETGGDKDLGADEESAQSSGSDSDTSGEESGGETLCLHQEDCEFGCDVTRGACYESPPIAVAAGYGGRRVRSTDGTTWTDLIEIDPNGGDDENLLRGIGYGAGVFLAVGGAGEGFSTSSRDGIAWENENRDVRDFLSNTAYFGGRFVAAGGNGLRTFTEDAGLSWDEGTDYYAGHYRDIAAGPERVVAVGHTYEGVGMVSSSEDGQTWSAPVVGGGPLNNIVYAAGYFVAAGQEGRVSVSEDGVTWETQQIDATSSRVAFVGGHFVVLGTGGYWRFSEDEWVFEALDGAREVAAEFGAGSLHLGWPATIDRSVDLASWERVLDLGGSGLTRIAVGPPGDL